MNDSVSVVLMERTNETVMTISFRMCDIFYRLGYPHAAKKTKSTVDDWSDRP